jgi:hypothetical protein
LNWLRCGIVFVLSNLQNNFADMLATRQKTESFFNVFGIERICLDRFDDASFNIVSDELLKELKEDRDIS